MGQAEGVLGPRDLLSPAKARKAQEKGKKKGKKEAKKKGKKSGKKDADTVADPNTCSKCGKEDEEKLSRCGRCQAVRYCSRECQLADWAKHKKACTLAQTFTLTTPAGNEHKVPVPKGVELYSLVLDVNEILQKDAAEAVAAV